MEINQNKLKAILAKMNVEDDTIYSKKTKKTKHTTKDNKITKQRINKSNKRKQPTKNTSLLTKFLGFFNTNTKETNTDETLLDIQSRFNNQDSVQSIKKKLINPSNKSTKSTYVDDSIFNSKGKNFYKTPLLKEAPKEEEITLKQLTDKLKDYEKTIGALEKTVSDMSNEITLMQQQNKHDGFVDMSLIKEKRKINNLQSSDPVIPFEENSNNNINTSARKRIYPDIMPFDKLSPIKRQNTFAARENSILEGSPREKKKANAITSSPTKKYKGDKLSNSNITRLLRNEQGKDDDSYDWRQIEEDSISSSDIE